MKLVVAALFLAACSTDTFTTPDAASDAATDASLDGSAGGGDGSPCTPLTTACSSGADCASFDDGTTGGFEVYVVGDANESITTANYVSCPGALETTLAGVDAGATDYFGGVVGTLSASGTDVSAKLSAEVFLPTQPSADTLVLMSVGANKDSSTAVALVYLGGQWTLRTSATSANFQPLTNAWNPITLTVHFVGGSGTSGSAEITYLDDQRQQQKKDIAVAPVVQATIGSLQGTVGIGTLGGSNAATAVYYDDLTFALGQ